MAKLEYAVDGWELLKKSERIINFLEIDRTMKYPTEFIY